jgi:hypothetical protein
MRSLGSAERSLGSGEFCQASDARTAADWPLAAQAVRLGGKGNEDVIRVK